MAKNTKNFSKKFKDIKSERVRLEIGYFNESRYPDGGMPVAQIAAIQQYGNKHIPARPFMTIATENIKKEIKKQIKKRNHKNFLEYIGMYGVNQIKEAITDLRSPPNDPATVKRKGSSNPLIDTARLRNSADYKIKKEK